MTHELKAIIERYESGRTEGQAAVLATVVALDGSSYRRPGVRMLIFDNGEMVGAVSGGCVEKEVLRQAASVFGNGLPKVMVYDGRYRLGCEGILYILLESFAPNEQFLMEFEQTVRDRKPFSITSYFEKEHSENDQYGSIFHFPKKDMVLQNKKGDRLHLSTFKQELQPCFQLVVIGAEHDAVQLCHYAGLTGWEVTVVADPWEEKTEDHFPDIHKLVQNGPESFGTALDAQTAVVLMTHSFAKDLAFLEVLKDKKCAYMGLLGPLQRREKLFDGLLERHPDISGDFLEAIHGPAGIDIGAETPQEIAISIISEILATVNGREPQLLKEKSGRIHN